jgi:LTXXQ motif family protein
MAPVEKSASRTNVGVEDEESQRHSDEDIAPHTACTHGLRRIRTRRRAEVTAGSSAKAFARQALLIVDGGGGPVDGAGADTIELRIRRHARRAAIQPIPNSRSIMETEQMTSPTSGLRTRLKLCVALGVAVIILLNAPRPGVAQGLVKGVEQGAREGNKAAGPVGGVLGGAIGGVVGVVTGVTGTFTGNNGQQPAPDTKQGDPKAAKGNTDKANTTKANTSKVAKSGKPIQVLTQQGEPQVTPEQIVASNDADIERIKTELNLTPEQEKSWFGFSSAMHYLGHNGADRLNLRVARAKRDPPDDIVEQMRNEAQFLVDRATDQRNVADAAEPLYASLDDKQKQIFVQEMVRLSHERGLD